MITHLSIRNFGLIDQLEIEFCRQLNIFTGETGAGKSILIDALRYALGERLNSAQIRDSDKPCVVEVFFELSKKQVKDMPVLAEYVSEDEPGLIISRTCFPDGRNRVKANDFTVTVSRLKEIGDALVDFHGPHDHQMLFSEEAHLNILDRLCDTEGLKQEYLKSYNDYLLLQKELQELEELSKNREREQDMLKYQIEELEQVPLEQVKYEELLQEHTRVNNAEKLYECVSQLINILDRDEAGVTDAVGQAFGPMENLNSLDETTVEFKDVLTRVQEDSNSLLAMLTGYLDNLSFEPQETGEINRRYDSYYEIIKKYGPTLEDAGRFYEAAKQKYERLINLEHNDADLREKIQTAQKNLVKIAQKITAQRRKGAQGLEETIEKELKDLGIVHVDFECRITKTELNRDGQDRVVFYISPNAGEDLKPLSEIVSSGEAARVMLALKKALTRVDPVPVLIFDEIDAQIGGRLGTITGKKLKELSQDRQVILITHLPQIASFGDSHFKVAKQVKNNRTIVNVDVLDQDMRVKELAEMMSGKKKSQLAVDHAQDMFSRARE